MLKGLWEEMYDPDGDTCMFQTSIEVTLVLFPLRLNVYFELRHPQNLVKSEYLWINFVLLSSIYYILIFLNIMLGPKY